jgi:transcriptional regulator with XRE-family HTH domain
MVTHKGGYLVRKLREEKGLNQTELAKLVGIGQTQMSEIESNKKNPSIKVLQKLADVLGFTFDDFFRREAV